MDHLNLLQISSPADGLIYLNGTLAGELLGGELSLCIPRGRFCLSFSPLGQEEGKVFLPFSRILDLSQPEPAIVQDDGVLCVYLLGEVCCVQLTPPYASVPSLPYLIAARSLRSNGPPLRAQLYFDRVLCFSLEENGRILFAAPLPFEAESGSISAVWLGGELYALAELIGKDKKALACLAVQAKKLLFCEPCLCYKVSKEELELFCPAGECGYQIRRQTLPAPSAQQLRAGMPRLPFPFSPPPSRGSSAFRTFWSFLAILSLRPINLSVRGNWPAAKSSQSISLPCADSLWICGMERSITSASFSQQQLSL